MPYHCQRKADHCLSLSVSCSTTISAQKLRSRNASTAEGSILQKIVAKKMTLTTSLLTIKQHGICMLFLASTAMMTAVLFKANQMHLPTTYGPSICIIATCKLTCSFYSKTGPWKLHSHTSRNITLTGSTQTPAIPARVASSITKLISNERLGSDRSCCNIQTYI